MKPSYQSTWTKAVQPVGEIKIPTGFESAPLSYLCKNFATASVRVRTCSFS